MRVDWRLLGSMADSIHPDSGRRTAEEEEEDGYDGVPRADYAELLPHNGALHHHVRLLSPLPLAARIPLTPLEPR